MHVLLTAFLLACAACAVDGCPAGSYCPTVDTVIACSVGYFCPGGTTSPTLCPAGFYCGSPGLAFPLPCASCPAGATAPIACADSAVTAQMAGLVTGSTTASWFDPVAGAFSSMVLPDVVASNGIKSVAFSRNGKVMYFGDYSSNIYGFIPSLGLSMVLTSVNNVGTIRMSYEEDALIVYGNPNFYAGCYSISLSTFQQTYLFYTSSYGDFTPVPGGVLAPSNGLISFYSYAATTFTTVVGSPATTMCIAGVGLNSKIGTPAAITSSVSGANAYIYDRGCRQIFKVDLATYTLSILWTIPAMASWYPKIAVSADEKYLVAVDFSTTVHVYNLLTGVDNAKTAATAPSDVSMALTTPCTGSQFTCPEGYFCTSPSNQTACPAQSNSTAGATAISQCVCVPGTYLSGAQCATCPAGSQCRNNTVTACPAGTTSLANATSYLDCWCKPGTVGSTINATAASCAPCAPGHFCGAARVSISCGCIV